jgi:hypothetical protein
MRLPPLLRDLIGEPTLHAYNTGEGTPSARPSVMTSSGSAPGKCGRGCAYPAGSIKAPALLAIVVTCSSQRAGHSRALLL